jgi:serine/threonine-protein kinase
MIADPKPGDVVDERFEILESLGRGGMGMVFKAIDLETGRAAAIKFPFFELESHPAFYSRFQREIEIGKALNHPGVLKIFAVAHPSRPYLAAEFVDGETLSDMLERTPTVPIDEALRIAARLADALAYLHGRGIVHRDLKPGNVMIGRDGSVRIMDFGIAKTGAARRLTFAGFTERLGTPRYMAPEQVKGQRGDARTDIYSLGAILYEMATGHSPYDEQSDLYTVMHARLSGDPTAPRVHNADIPLKVEEIILRALARNPADRYQSADALKADILDPARVVVTGRAQRLVAPSLTARRWRAARMIAISLIAPVILFFLLFLALKK